MLQIDPGRQRQVRPDGKFAISSRQRSYTACLSKYFPSKFPAAGKYIQTNNSKDPTAWRDLLMCLKKQKTLLQSDKHQTLILFVLFPSNTSPKVRRRRSEGENV